MRQNARKAFTLVELMLVIALMGVMGTLAVGAYSAVTRGMSDRAALNAADSLLEAALQRAQIDRAPTYVYLFNEVLRLDDSATTTALMQGVMIAVRPCGRITRVEGDLVCDEFGDLDRAYKSLQGSGIGAGASAQQAAASAMRLYNITRQGYASVDEGFYSTTVSEEDLEEGDDGAVVQWLVYGFKRQSGATFSVGDEYGQEFAVTRLPPGYVFSSSVSASSENDLGMQNVGFKRLLPSDSNAPAVTIYALRATGLDPIGTSGSSNDSAGES